MQRKIVYIILGFLSILNYAQVDDLSYHIQYDPNAPLIKVEQDMKVYRSNTDSVYYFYAWANAYKDRTTVLSQMKLNQRKDDIYFADIEERGWLDNIEFELLSNGKLVESLAFEYVNNELIKVNVPRKKALEIKAKYTIHLPSNRFTGYGRDKSGNLLLKYFFIQPEVRQDGLLLMQSYKDFESLTANNANYTVVFDLPAGYELYTDLKQRDVGKYSAKNRDFFQISLQKIGTNRTIITPDGTVIFNRTFPENEDILIQKIVSKQLKFLAQRFGKINEPLFISNKSYKKNKFSGVQDVKIPIINKTYELFDSEDRIRLEMITQLTDAYLDRTMKVNMHTDHWIKNGLGHYIMLEYLDKELPDLLAAGNLPDDIGVWNIKPLKLLKASEVKMKDRSKWFYQIVLQSNYNQAIDTPFDELSNANQEIISGVKTGLAFQYLAAYLAPGEFDKAVKQWVHSTQGTLTVEEFKQSLQSNASKPINWFFDEMIKEAAWYDLSIRKVDIKEDSTVVKVKNKGNINIPIRVVGYKEGEEMVASQWVQNSNKKFEITFPDANYSKFVINDSLKLPDFNSENDEYHLDTFFRRETSYGLFTDVPFKEYNQVFFWPNFSWNNYDKLQLGVSISNKTILPQQWVYKISPQYSLGENSLTGKFSLVRNIYPRHNFFRHIKIYTNGSYRHYNKGLAYRSLGAGFQGTFRKDPRSTKNRGVFAYHQQINRDVRKSDPLGEQEINKYGLLNVGYNYWNTNIIHERIMLLNLQVSNTFSKVFGEYYYRWKFNEDQKIGVRLFAGAFISHDLNYSEHFDFGLDRLSDYAYSYPLLGRSETTGTLSQQFVLAEGGFKSNFFKKSNQLMITTNWELPIWRFIDAYVDLGYLKNKDEKGEFLYDTGVRLRIVPDFLELYFPVQSSLGFEPTLGAYHERIRFMLNLDFNKFINYWKRGKQ